MFEDKTMTCCVCGSEYVFTAAEQQVYKERGLQNEPKRCPACRAVKAATRRTQTDPDSGNLIVCALCGRRVNVNFKIPRGRAMYCSTCYGQIRDIPKEGVESIGS